MAPLGLSLAVRTLSEAHDIVEAQKLFGANPSEELARELAWSAADSGCPEIVELALAHLHWPVKDPRWHWILIQPVRGAASGFSQSEGHLQSMAVLLRRGVDPNVSRLGQTALRFAAARPAVFQVRIGPDSLRC